MKKLLVFLLLPLLCLSLAACETEPLPTETDILVTLPTVTDWKEAPASTAAASEQAPSTVPMETEAAPEPGPAEAEVPVLLGRTTLYGKISGPAGTVYAIGYQGAACKEPVYGDVDGDGRTELVYHNASESGGSTYELVCVYDLEAGWPICKAWILLCAGQGRLVVKTCKRCFPRRGHERLWRITGVRQYAGRIRTVNIIDNCQNNFMHAKAPGNIRGLLCGFICVRVSLLQHLRFLLK